MIERYEVYSLPDIVHGMTMEKKLAPGLSPDIVIVSIGNKGDPVPDFTAPFVKEVLRLEFLDEDVESDSEEERILGSNLFTKEQANQVIDFNQRWVNSPTDITLIAHCHMGQCRSPAVIAACALINGDREVEKFYFRTKTPNRYVYRKILERAVELKVWNP